MVDCGGIVGAGQGFVAFGCGVHVEVLRLCWTREGLLEDCFIYDDDFRYWRLFLFVLFVFGFDDFLSREASTAARDLILSSLDRQ